MQVRTDLKYGPFLLRFNWVVGFFVLVTITSFVYLGLWQLDRASEKVAAMEALQVEQSKHAVAIQDLTRVSHNKQGELDNLHVELTGQYINERSILLVSKFYGDSVGYEVVTPFRVESNGLVVLVNRGWISAKLTSGARLNLRPVSGPQRITAQIHDPGKVSQAYSSQMNTTTWPIQMRGLDMEVVTDLLKEELFPFAVRLTEGQPGVLVRNWPAVDVNINTHLAYALQWFVFALVVLAGSLLASTNILSLLREGQ
jgi:surfeit locus 1 family protein